MKLSLLLWAASFMPTPMADQVCLATTVYLEARNQPIAGQYAVAEVALRRRESGRYGRTVCAVVQQPRQFAPTLVSGDTAIRNSRAWQRSWEVAERSLTLFRMPRNLRPLVVPGADHFFAVNLVSPNWAVGAPIATIGDHAFYKLH